MSPDSRTTRSSAAASLVISSAKAFLMRSPSSAVRLRDFSAVGDAVVPVVVVFHERHALALDGVGDDARPACRVPFGTLRISARRARRGRGRRPRARPSRTPPTSSRSGRERQHLVAAAGRLPLVVVDDDADVLELLGGREHRRLPDRALVALAVAQQREDAVAAALDPAASAMPSAERQAVAERAGRRLDARHAVAGRDARPAGRRPRCRSPAAPPGRSRARPAPRRAPSPRGPCSG